MQIEGAFAKFLTQLQADGRSQHTIKQYSRHIRLFAHWIADVAHGGDIKEITHEDIARFLNASVANVCHHGGKKRASTVNALRTSLKGFFEYLHKAGYIKTDPSHLVRRAICGTPPPRALTNEEKDRLIEALAQADGPENRRDFALFHMMLATGIRLGSALALCAEDVDLYRGEILLQAAKGNRPERIFLGREIRIHLQKYMASCPNDGPLFTGKHGRSLSPRHVQRRFSFWLKKAGIYSNYTPHSLRHTFASNLYNRTSDILLVKYALTHRSITSTLIYAKVSDSRLKHAFDM